MAALSMPWIDASTERFEFRFDDVTTVERAVLRAAVVPVILGEDRGLAELVELTFDTDFTGVEAVTVLDDASCADGACTGVQQPSRRLPCNRRRS